MGSMIYCLPASFEGEYEVPEGIEVAVRDAFRTEGLTKLTLPSSMQYIYGAAFVEVTTLRDIYFYGIEVPVTFGDTFANFDRSSCTLHVFEEMVTAFQGDENWSEFNIVGDLGSAGSYGEMAAEDYAALCNLYSALGGTSWKHRWNINKNSVLPAAWHGVTFDNGHVTEIDLSNNNLVGDISELTLGLPALTRLNLSKNHLTGDVTPLANSLEALTWLNLAENELTEVSAPLSQNICDLDLRGQYIGDLGESTLNDVLNVNLPNIFYYNHSIKDYNETYINTNTPWVLYPVEEGRGDVVFWGDLEETRDAFTASNGAKVALRNTDTPSFTFNIQFESGDANLDDVVNIQDLQQTLNFSNRWGDYRSIGGIFNMAAADTYKDGDITVQDIVATVNILLNVDPQTAAARRAQAKAGKQQTEAWLSIEGSDIVLNSQKAVAALDLRIDGVKPEAINWSMPGFVTAAMEQGNGTHAIVYSMNGDEIEAGRIVIGHVNANAVIADAVLSDINARRIPVAVDGDITGIDGIDGANGGESYTNVGGVRAVNPNHGVYIVRKNGTTKKVSIK